MASVTSLGVSTPSAIPYLISEGVLPPDPAASLYTWKTSSVDGSREDAAIEELLYTETAVAWSRGGLLRKLYTFDIEGEPVKHAVFALFKEEIQQQLPRSTNEESKNNNNNALGISHLSPYERQISPRPEFYKGDDITKDGKHENYEFTTRLPLFCKKEDPYRALVVFLKSQAHVYFLSGTHYLVHLPFEVAAVFSLPSGLFLQRKLGSKDFPVSSPSVPAPPVSSFAFSQMGSFAQLPQNQERMGLLGTNEDDCAPAIRAMLDSVLGQKQEARHVVTPAHFLLSDPLTEFSVVIESCERHGKRRGTGNSKILSPHEHIIHVAQIDHSRDYKTNIITATSMLAISINRISGQYNVWAVTGVGSLATNRPDRRKSAATSGAASRRRSSFGPGTGATTPAMRTSMGPRESFGQFRESKGDDMIHDDHDLASQLDPAFENPSAPLKSSRRISSLLARSELSGNRDPSGFADLTSAHSKTTARRGPSFGGPGSRKSFGIQGTQERNRRTMSSSYPTIDSPLRKGANENQTESESDVDSSSSLGADTSPTIYLKHGLTFSKIHSFNANSSFSSSPATDSNLLTSVNVFQLDPPKHSKEDSNTSQSVFCVMDHDSQHFYIIRVSIASSGAANARKTDTPPDMRVVDVHRGQGVIDACKISDGFTSRALVLSRGGSGLDQLSLQSPWSIESMLQLPHEFLAHHPYQTDHTRTPQRRRDGSFRRVLSEGPDQIVAVKHCPARGQVELCDSSGTKHRLEVKLNPRNSLISRAFQVCEFVLPTNDREREPFQRLWWDTMAWLTERRFQGDLEWKAFLVAIFSLFVNCLDSSKSTNPVRTKRKGGLLRSSSGANTDLSNFDEMWKSECSSKGPLPRWMQQDCWGWIAEDQRGSDSQSSSPQSKSKRSSGSFQAEEASTLGRKVALEPEFVELAKEFVQTEAGIRAVGKDGYLPTALSVETSQRHIAMPTILVALHLLREELKLDILATESLHSLTPLLAQLGGWLGWDDWGWKPFSYYMLESTDMDRLAFSEGSLYIPTDISQPIAPPSILGFVEAMTNGVQGHTYPSLSDVAVPRSTAAITYAQGKLTPRTTFILKFLHMDDGSPSSLLHLMESHSVTVSNLDTLPEGVAAPLRSALASCQANPMSSISSKALDLIDRNDIALLNEKQVVIKPQFRGTELVVHEAVRDYHSICTSTLDTEPVSAYDGSAEMDRQAVTRMVFREDQRFAEAAKLVHPLRRAVARCDPDEDWNDTDLLEAQQEIAKVVAIRTLSVSPGRGMLFYSARFPLLTEKFPIHGFSLACIMKPSGTVVTADKNIYTEEKVAWAFFHAGVEAGLSISKYARGIDTSWILFNKPLELNNRHAGFLLALGLNGHLRNIAKWVAFKYLTPKHTMTSIGLLLGLAASYLGTMDTLITRLLSVHVTRMLPPGAAELNLSPLTQTTGIMAIGLLYCNTQHRRMSEIMLSEMENIELDDANNPLENLRDEGYRLAAGFALGFINLGQGKKMSGLRDMRIVERLLALAVATKRVDIVHILDKATAAATVATALIFMKTGDEALAKKIDIPDTPHQFVYVRPDIFLLRTVARHLIMWEKIIPSFAWIQDSLPPSLKDQAKLGHYKYLNSEKLPLFNIIAGLCLSLGLKFAGTARPDVRDLLVHYLDSFMTTTRTAGTSYDEKLTRITARNCQDVVALAAASVMAGTGDICLFRRFRVLHSRTDPDTPYGSHLAAHQAIGVLFLGGGTHTFSTSNLAVASLLCAFYPLFPTGVLDNKSHLQAFRHFWVMASEPRCLIVRNVEARRPISMEVKIVLKDGQELLWQAPCLLPALETIARVESHDPQYWPVKLDFENNESHCTAFGRHQSLFVRRRGAYNASKTVFGTAIRALNDAAMAHQISKHSFEWIFSLPSFANFDRAERTLVLPADGASLVHNAARSTVVDSRLTLERGSLVSSRAEQLWDLRVLFAWADKVAREKEELNWLGKEVLEGLRAGVVLMGKEAAQSS